MSETSHVVGEHTGHYRPCNAFNPEHFNVQSHEHKENGELVKFPAHPAIMPISQEPR